jgi:hypothetical protein
MTDNDPTITKLAPKPTKRFTLPFSAIMADDDASHQKESMSQFIRRDAKQREDHTDG